MGFSDGRENRRGGEDDRQSEEVDRREGSVHRAGVHAAVEPNAPRGHRTVPGRVGGAAVQGGVRAGKQRAQFAENDGRLDRVPETPQTVVGPHPHTAGHQGKFVAHRRPTVRRASEAHQLQSVLNDNDVRWRIFFFYIPFLRIAILLFFYFIPSLVKYFNF